MRTDRQGLRSKALHSLTLWPRTAWRLEGSMRDSKSRGPDMPGTKATIGPAAEKTKHVTSCHFFCPMLVPSSFPWAEKGEDASCSPRFSWVRNSAHLLTQQKPRRGAAEERGEKGGVASNIKQVYQKHHIAKRKDEQNLRLANCFFMCSTHCVVWQRMFAPIIRTILSHKTTACGKLFRHELFFSWLQSTETWHCARSPAENKDIFQLTWTGARSDQHVT